MQFLISLDIDVLNTIMWLVDRNNSFLVKLISLFSDFWILFIALSLIVLWIYWTIKKDNSYKIMSLNIFYTISFSFMIYLIINNFFPIRPRPETLSTIKPIIDHLPDNSFPSWHAIFAWASIVWFCLFYGNFTYILVLILLSLLMLFSRVASWVHYPWDIIVGLILGILFGLIFYRLQKIESIKNILDKISIFLIKIANIIKL